MKKVFLLHAQKPKRRARAWSQSEWEKGFETFLGMLKRALRGMYAGAKIMVRCRWHGVLSLKSEENSLSLEFNRRSP